jgi:hypothetical protein
MASRTFMASVSGVSIRPGATTFTRIPRGCKIMASEAPRLRKAALLAE